MFMVNSMVNLQDCNLRAVQKLQPINREVTEQEYFSNRSVSQYYNWSIYTYKWSFIFALLAQIQYSINVAQLLN